MPTTPAPRPRFHVGPCHRRSGLRQRSAAALLLGLGALASCATTAREAGPPDPTVEARAEAATVPARRLHILFDWNLTDRDARFNGRGVVRVDHGYRVRVDLFGPRGETLAAAIVEDEHMRIVPPGADRLLPPPAMLWSTLGVFRRPTDAALVSTTDGPSGSRLGYARDGARWTFDFEDDALRSTEWHSGGARRTVVLSGQSGLGLPLQAVFRDWSEFRELTLRVTDVEEQRGFEPGVWILPGDD